MKLTPVGGEGSAGRLLRDAAHTRRAPGNAILASHVRAPMPVHLHHSHIVSVTWARDAARDIISLIFPSDHMAPPAQCARDVAAAFDDLDAATRFLVDVRGVSTITALHTALETTQRIANPGRRASRVAVVGRRKLIESFVATFAYPTDAYRVFDASDDAIGWLMGAPITPSSR